MCVCTHIGTKAELKNLVSVGTLKFTGSIGISILGLDKEFSLLDFL